MASTKESTNKFPEGNIRFVEYKKAALATGDYEIVIEHEIKTKNQPVLKIPSSSKKFTVRGERFQLDQSDIHSCFPPDKAEGDFSSCLPHLVLKNDMLPWERTACSGRQSEPWLALLLFDEQEMASIETKTVRLSELNRPTGWLERGESGETQCRTLEVPIEILKNIIPSLEDLQWLCHIRQVGNERKEDTSDGYHTAYSVIIGNRLPQKDKKNTVHLVSLEGYYDYTTTRKSWYSLTNNKVQLICLKSWSFISTKKLYSFQEEAKKLNTAVLRSSRVVEEKSLNNLLLNGYTLLRHQIRQGDKTASLYRGPLAPCFIPLTIELPVTSADEVIRLYQDTGLFDVSYATAWQLGRLLALKDSDFSTVIYKWRRENRHKDIIKKEQEEAEKEMGTSALKTQITSDSDETFDLFSQVTKWLARLKILSGVPLHYLVSDMENMLPENSIRFFSVDENWIHSLVDGAVSIGRTTTADLHHDRITVKAVIEQAERAARQSRKEQDGSQEDADDQQSFKSFTGFLIRSEMIVNWPGLEIEAYSDTNTSPDTDKKLSLISMRRLDDNILICLFKGELQRIDIHPPAEGLHYGIDQTKEGIKIRHPQKGSYGSNPKYVSDLLFKDDLKSVLDVHDLAKKISKLFETDKDFFTFTSAQFALAMISESRRVSFLKADS